MNIIEIYKKYHLPENLQMHMLRVAACSNLIIDNWTGEKIDKEAITRVCLLHDMGNMVKIPEDFSKDKDFLQIRKKYFDKHGTNDHEINLEIGKQEGLTEKEIVILDGKRSRKNEETLKSDSYEIKICAYCDQRVAPDKNGLIPKPIQKYYGKFKVDVVEYMYANHLSFEKTAIHFGLPSSTNVVLWKQMYDEKGARIFA